jgi:hypothetical protein
MVQAGRKFTVDAVCAIDCDAKLVAYLSETVELDLNEQVKITTEEAPDETLLKISIPTTYNFNEIQLVVSATNKPEVKTGVEMYINYGKEGIPTPTKANHQPMKIFNWGQSKAVVLRKGQEIKEGDKIYVLLTMGANT